MNSIKMISITAPFKAAALVGILGLCCSISNASASASAPNTIKNSVVYSYALPAGHSEGRSIKATFNKSSFEVMNDKPLLRIPQQEMVEYIPKKTARRNDIFELAVIFNDKLQQFLSVISQPVIKKAQAKSITEQLPKQAPKKELNEISTCKSKN